MNVLMRIIDQITSIGIPSLAFLRLVPAIQILLTDRNPRPTHRSATRLLRGSSIAYLGSFGFLWKSCISFLLVFILNGILLTTFAQWHNWQIGAGAGSLTYNGDLSDRFVNMHLQEAGYHLLVERKLVQSVYLRLETVNGHLRGSDRAKSGWVNRGFDNPNYYRSLNFRAPFHDIHLTGVFYLNLGRHKEMMPRVAPYARAGIGVGIFDVYGDLIYNKTGDKYYFWGDGFIRDRAINDPDVANAQIIKRDGEFETNLRKLEIEKSYSRLKWQVPVAFGLRFRLSEKTSLMVEAQYTYNMTDYIDNVGDLPARADIADLFTLYAADPAGYIFNQPRNLGKKNNINDSYLYLSAGLGLHLESTAPPRFKAPVFYPGIFPSFPEETVNTDTGTSQTNTDRMKERPLTAEEQQLLEEIQRITDSVQRLLNQQILDSLIRKDLRLYASLLPDQFKIHDTISTDSISIVRDTTSDRQWLLHYHTTLSKLSETDTNGTSGGIRLYPAVYRTDTLRVDSIPLPDSLICQKINDISQDISERVKVLNSSFLIPVEDPAVSDTMSQELRMKSATTTMTFAPVPATTSSPLMKRDTIIIREKILERTIAGDTSIQIRLSELLNTLNSLDAQNRRNHLNSTNARIDSVNKALAYSGSPSRTNLQFTPVYTATEPYTPSKRERKKMEKRWQESYYTPVPVYTYISPRNSPGATSPVTPVPLPDSSNTDAKDTLRTPMTDSIDSNTPSPDSSAQSAVHKNDTLGVTPVIEKSPVIEEIRQLQQQLLYLQSAQDSILDILKSIKDEQALQKSSSEKTVTWQSDSSKAMELLINQPAVRVFFGVGKSAISSAYYPALDKIAAQLRQYPSLKIEIRGFADPSGNAVANMKLSEKRASAVKQYFVYQQQIPEEKLVVLPVGQENDTQDFAFSRRVEIRIIR